MNLKMCWQVSTQVTQKEKSKVQQLQRVVVHNIQPLGYLDILLLTIRFVITILYMCLIAKHISDRQIILQQVRHYSMYVCIYVHKNF